uniref:Uncharacterized protein n=1 Tax=Sinocyclocheilus anshuiensis TaxID=1608454 RepID=A0A671S3S4_9TELE
MIPLSIVHFFVHSQCLGCAWSHIQKQIQKTIQHLNGKKVYLLCERALGLFCLLLRFPMAKEEKSIGLSGAEVKGNRTGFRSVPFRKRDEGFWCLKSDGI